MDSDPQTAYGFHLLEGQSPAIRTLEGMRVSGRLPQGLLFSGMPGTGKSLAARTLMMVENCRDSEAPCGHCRSCRKILMDQHPDFIAIQPLNGVIRIDMIRKMIEQLIRKPHEARKRFVLLEDAHAMNREAANALLKVLEEPPDATSFILMTPEPQRLLETIRSRCQEIRFLPMPVKTLAEKLRPMAEDDAAAMSAARLACGNLLLGQSLIREDHKRKILARIFSHGLSLEPAKALALSEWLTPDRSGTEISLILMEGLFRDICLAATDANVLCIHGLFDDCRQEITEAGKKILPEQAMDMIQRIRDMRRHMDQNILPRLAMDAILMNPDNAACRCPAA
ncbi:DNA polymerase-3 subunit delta' [Desulfobotulus alkaliphilus]|uniref:DNA polymerase-3 subunit delta n=1 Tax=Desulfobotulus alkaliphilus TaxID=622671 RepID=A0A562S9T6_9BACT|nr:DNA polymerase III subunit delta' [Desulfobotulus alkaliphilus]TWI77266.1 DNA polymerase-3 subunit delta' [Desulfobotulus alkaliphilus]